MEGSPQILTFYVFDTNKFLTPWTGLHCPLDCLEFVWDCLMTNNTLITLKHFKNYKSTFNNFESKSTFLAVN